MPGINSTGLPNTDDYNLGRGKVFFASLTAGIPGAYRDLGNAPEFNISIESETLEHQSSREGLKTTDKEVVISQKMTLSLTLDEINFENLAALFSGATASHTNVAVAGFSKYEMVGAVELGRWYDIVNSSNERAYDLTETGDLVLNNGDDDTLLVEDTDYTADLVMGRVFLLSTATNISAGEALDVTLTADAAPTASIDEVRALTQTSVTGALKFIAENPAASDHQTEFQFHQVSLKAEGDFGLISDEFSTMQFTAVAERNELADSLSPTLTVRTFAQ